MCEGSVNGAVFKVYGYKDKKRGVNVDMEHKNNKYFLSFRGEAQLLELNLAQLRPEPMTIKTDHMEYIEIVDFSPTNYNCIFDTSEAQFIGPETLAFMSSYVLAGVQRLKNDKSFIDEIKLKPKERKGKNFMVLGSGILGLSVCVYCVWRYMPSLYARFINT